MVERVLIVLFAAALGVASPAVAQTEESANADAAPESSESGDDGGDEAADGDATSAEVSEDSGDEVSEDSGDEVSEDSGDGAGDPSDEAAGAASLPERAIPDYDGRGEEPLQPGEAALWVPRIVFFPFWFVAEYVLRRPLAFLISGAEEKEIPERIVNFFTFGPEGNVTLAPTFSFDFGFRPNIGLYFAYNELGGNEALALRAGASFGGPQWIAGRVALRVEKPDGDTSFEIGFNATKRPDGLFYGLGSQISQENRSRYDWVGYVGHMTLMQRLMRTSSFAVGVEIVDRQFGDDIIEGDYSVEERVAAGQFELPPGYAQGYSIARQRAHLILDNRRSRPAPGSGVRLEADYELGFDLQNGPNRNLWVTWSTSFGAYWDISDHQHVVSLTASLIAAETLSGQVPFFEQPNLSGSAGTMRGFISRYLSGDSGASLLLRYDWPIWVFLDGTIQVAYGNVYDGRFADFSLKNNRFSASIGFAAVDKRDHFFEFLVGFGTETVAQGAQVESFRLMVGGTQDF
ncbi:MAG: hypothetical protein CMN30_29370 [Sandaracinus sp.]|nr:hypothetical protein [Sandaracinus sp.]